MVAKNTTEAAAPTTSIELRGEREVLVARTFHAPPRHVFDAWTQPELVRKWWAPKGMGAEVVECQADLRVGGKYRYVLRGPGGEMAFSGRYTEISPPSRLVYTHVFEPMAAAGELVVTVTFTEEGGRTRLVAHEVYPAPHVRAAALAAGAEHGRRDTMDQLEALVQGVAAHGERKPS